MLLPHFHYRPSQWILAVILAVSLVGLTRTALASPSEEQIIQQLAQDILLNYVSGSGGYSTDRQLTVGIDGPPGSGKSWFIQKLKKELERLIQELGLGLTIGGFGGDTCLRPRADRRELFETEHGLLGVSGNCDGREYRWKDLEQAVKAISLGMSFRIRPYDRDTGGLGLATTFHLTENIVIVEGTHTLAERLFPYIQYPIFLDIDDNLMAWSRRQRDHKRGWEKVLATLKVVFDGLQLVQWRTRYRNQAWAQLRYVPVVELPELTEQNFNDTPDNLDRELRLLSTGGAFRLLQTHHQGEMSTTLSPAVNRLLSGVGLTEATSALSVHGFMSQLLVILGRLGLNLQSLAHGNNCLFQALGHVLGDRFSSRKKVIAILSRLLEKIQAGQLSPAQSRLLEWLANSLDSEIQHLVTDQWGGLPTVMYIWASLLGYTQIPPFAPLVLLINTGAQIETWQFNADGSIAQLNATPVNTPLLIFDGFGSWHAATLPETVLQHTNSVPDSGYLDGSDESSPPAPGSPSLDQSPVCLAGDECQYDLGGHVPPDVQPLNLREHLIGESLF
ncbi:MAG: hypothetical protein ACR2PT_08715 [Endozoicomonas sp.]